MSQDLRLQPPGSNALFGWMRHYRRAWLAGDLTAGLVVGIMIIPQSMAYAMLAGLPVQIGLYASILPLIGHTAAQQYDPVGRAGDRHPARAACDGWLR